MEQRQGPRSSTTFLEATDQQTSTDWLRRHLDWGKRQGPLQKEGDILDPLDQLPTGFWTQKEMNRGQMHFFLFACVLSTAAMWGGRRGLEAYVASTHLESFEIWFCSSLSQTRYLGYIIDLAGIIASSWCYEKNVQHMVSESVKAFGTDPRRTYQCYPRVYVRYIRPVEAWEKLVMGAFTEHSAPETLVLCSDPEIYVGTWGKSLPHFGSSFSLSVKQIHWRFFSPTSKNPTFVLSLNTYFYS